MLSKCKDQLITVKFKFFEKIAAKLNIFLKRFQTNAPMVLFLAGAQLGRWGGGRGSFPCPFLKIKKSALISGKKGPNYAHPLAKFVIQNVVLRASKRKNSKTFRCGTFFLDFLIKCLSKCPNFTKPLLP